MPRRPRVFIPGGIYHVYNRISSGERVLEGEGEALEFIELARGAKQRDGWMVFAWCLLANHFHLVVRAGEVPLWRGLHRIQNLFSRQYNKRSQRTGPLWQSRYQAKLVGNERYLNQLILYVHLNPVRAGLVEDPVRHPYSGHVEIVGKKTWGFVDVDQALLCFEETRRKALRRYRSGIAAAIAPGSDAGEPVRVSKGPLDDEDLWFPEGAPYVDTLRRSTAPERPTVSAELFLKAASAVLEVELELLAGRTKEATTVRARRLAAALAVERWGLSIGELALVLGKLPETASRWAGAGARLRITDREVRDSYESLDLALRQHFGSGEESPLPSSNNPIPKNC